MRIKRGVNAVKKRRKILKLAKGYFGGRFEEIQSGASGGHEIAELRVHRQKAQKERFPPAVDRAYQRRGEAQRPFLQQTDVRAEKRGHRTQQKNACGYRRERRRVVRRHLRTGESQLKEINKKELTSVSSF